MTHANKIKEFTLEQISKQKYNSWCERRPIVCPDKRRINSAAAFLVKRELTLFEKAAFYFHELTDCEGLEFVALSNIRLKNPVILSNNIMLVPCFLSDMDMEGKNIQDPLVQMTMKMHREGRFIYDGWLPIKQWDKNDVRKAIRSVDEALSIFCLHVSAFFDWQPKYMADYDRSLLSYYIFEEQHLQELEQVVKLLESLSEDDRIAIYRSLAWLSQALRLREPAARFLFLILAIESLATYIEKGKLPTNSPLASLRAEHFTPKEKRAMRDKCIKDKLSQFLQEDPKKAIIKAYFDCIVGIRQQIQRHLEHIFAPEDEAIALLFGNKDRGRSLYELRNEICHGRVDVLSEEERDKIHQLVWDTEQLARRYIFHVVEKALGIKPFSNEITAARFLSIQNGIAPREGMYQGPTHMAILYS